MAFYCRHCFTLLALVLLSSPIRAQEKIDILESMVRHVIDTQARLMEKMEGLNSEMESMKTNLATIIDNENGLNSEIESMKTNLATIINNENEIMNISSGIKADLNYLDIGLNSQIESMKTNLTTIINNESGLNSQIESMKTNLTTIINNESGLSSEIESMKTNLATIINNENDMKEAMQNINQTLSELVEKDLKATVGICSEEKNKSIIISPKDCQDILQNGGVEDGVYEIFPGGEGEGVQVYCDQTASGGGWTVFLRRRKQIPQVNFKKSFEQYAQGFGQQDGEYWLGNRNLHLMTKDHLHILRVEAINLKNVYRYATWGSFKVADQDSQFKISVDYYVANSTLGNGMSSKDGKRWHSNGMFFSTYDHGNSCPATVGGGGWWYNRCYGANPTGIMTEKDNGYDSLNWFYWNIHGTRSYTGLKAVTFMIRKK